LAKNQLSRLVKAALAGEEVIIASHGQPRAAAGAAGALQRVARSAPLRSPQRGIKEEERSRIKAAFSAEADHAAQQLIEG
jgi:antitoxin (DNA-binding transcriptional repressor) of toxin-antitoxin stability system